MATLHSVSFYFEYLARFAMLLFGLVVFVREMGITKTIVTYNLDSAETIIDSLVKGLEELVRKDAPDVKLRNNDQIQPEMVIVQDNSKSV